MSHRDGVTLHTNLVCSVTLVGRFITEFKALQVKIAAVLEFISLAIPDIVFSPLLIDMMELGAESADPIFIGSDRIASKAQYSGGALGFLERVREGCLEAKQLYMLMMCSAGRLKNAWSA